MLRKMVTISALLCFLAASNSAMAYNWGGQTNWTGAVDANWFNAANWSGGVPSNGLACIEPKPPGPIIDGDANCSALNIVPWGWSGAPDVSVDMNSGDFNCGDEILIISGSDLDYGDPNILGKGTLNVFGGTVTTPNPGAAGLTIGGGSSGYGNNFGRVNMYGGLISVPRITLQHGDVNLYGGTLECNGPEANFVFFQNKPENQININGGTLKIRCDAVNLFNGYIASGRIYSAHGVLGTPAYDSTWTTLTSADNNMIRAWNPSPAHNATNIRYRDTNSITLSWNKGGGYLDADGNEVNVIHKVYFGTTLAAVTNATDVCAEYKGARYDANGDPCNWTIQRSFTIGAPYYWRIDEVNTVSGACAKGLVWKFYVHNGKAYNPRPADVQYALSEPLTLNWTAGDWVNDINAHQVYVGTDSVSVLGAVPSTAKIFRGLQNRTSTSYKLTNLTTNWYGPLKPDTTYYWKITEVNGTTLWGDGAARSVVWSFKTAPYVNIDDFENYNSADGINANWPNGYTLTGCGGYQGLATGNSGRALIQDATGKYLRYTYINDTFGAGGMYFSEAKRPYSGGTSFTGGNMLSPTPKALRIDYLGSGINAVDPIKDRMYVAIEDTAGNVSVYQNPDAGAALVTSWTSWYSNLDDISALGVPDPVNLEAISGFAIGFGIRCEIAGDAGGVGNVMFDNIRLYAATCVPSEGPEADLDGDCDVDINDLDVLATDWLQHAENRVFADLTPPILVSPPAAPPVLWYKFDESSGGLCADSGTSTNPDRPPEGYTGTLFRVTDPQSGAPVPDWSPANWDADGSRNGTRCFNIPATNTALHSTYGQTFVEADSNALDFMSDDAHSVDNGGGGISFSVWINADWTAYQFLVQWPGLFSVSKTGAEIVEVHCPSNTPAGSLWSQVDFIKNTLTPGIRASVYLPLLDYGGRWNHFAFVKGYNNTPEEGHSRMAVYCNGLMVAHMDANAEDGDPNVNVSGPLYSMPLSHFRIATRGRDNTIWAPWSGKLGDFQVYDYALSAENVAYLASDGSGTLLLPLLTEANINKDGAPPEDQIVNFGDLSVMEDEWLLYHTTPKLWP